MRFPDVVARKIPAREELIAASRNARLKAPMLIL
jgi:hypothetical protein